MPHVKRWAAHQGANKIKSKNKQQMSKKLTQHTTAQNVQEMD